MTPPPHAEWTWSRDEIRRIGYRVIDLIAEHLTTLPDRPVFQPFPSSRADAMLHAPMAEEGATPDAILDEFAEGILPYPFGNGHPRFFGWVNSPPAVMGIFGDALAAAMNPSCAGGNHAAIYVERQVLNWLKTIIGFPADSMGLLVSGGSMAALTALAVARHVKAGHDVRQIGIRGVARELVLYKGQEGHGCHQKAIELLGIGSENLRIVSSDDALRIRPAALEEAIRSDRQAGRIPLAVIATAGTVNTGAIDPLAEIAEVCARHQVWLHVDAAYGGPAILTDDYRYVMNAIGRADSVALDPHKWLYVPVEAGAVFVRDAAMMRAAFTLVPPYLQTDGSVTGVAGVPWMSEYGFEQTRAFRALKVWMALRHYGLAGYKRAIEHDIGMAKLLAQQLAATGELEIWEPQSLSVVCFRYAADDDTNRTILERVQLGGDAFLSSTIINGRFWLRACVVNPRTTKDDIRTVVDVLRKTAKEGFHARSSAD